MLSATAPKAIRIINLDDPEPFWVMSRLAIKYENENLIVKKSRI